MRRYRALLENSYILIGYYDNIGFHVIKTMEPFKQMKNDLLRNDKKGVFQIPLSIFDDESATLDIMIKNKVSRKSLRNMFDFLKNYRNITEIPEL